MVTTQDTTVLIEVHHIVHTELEWQPQLEQHVSLVVHQAQQLQHVVYLALTLTKHQAL